MHNLASEIVPADGNAEFELLDDERLGLKFAPRHLERIPSGKLPDGTVFVRLGQGANGNRPPSYAFTPEGKVYSDGNRMMTHGGMSPWVLEYVTKYFVD